MAGSGIGLGLAEFGAFSPDGRWLATTGSGARVRVLDLAARRDVWRRGIVSHPRALLWSSRGDTLYVVGMGGRVVVLDPASGDTRRRFDHRTEDVDAGWALLDDAHLVHASFGGTLEILDVETGRTVKAWAPPGGRRLTRGLLVLPRDRGICVFTDTPPRDDESPPGAEHLHVWRPWTEVEPSRTVTLDPALGLSRAAASPDGARVAVFASRWGGGPTELVLVDVDRAVAAPGIPIGDRFAASLAAAWSPDGASVAIPAKEGVIVLSTTDGRTRWSVPARDVIIQLAWSPDGRWLFVGAEHALLVDATANHAAAPASPTWREEDGLAALMDLDARGAIDPDAMLSAVESALLLQLGEPSEVARLPSPVRTVLLTSCWESMVTWEGLATAVANLRDHLPGIAEAYRALGLVEVAGLFEELAASPPTAHEEGAGRDPGSVPDPFPRLESALESALEAAGLADAATGRIALIRRHRAAFARLA